MNDHPYRPEIIGTFLFAPLIMVIETWRRWGDLLSPAALDDFFIFGSAVLVAYALKRCNPLAPALWVFVCGGAWFLMCLSVWGSIHAYDQADPSGVPVIGVIAFKGCALTLISLASWRALRRVGLARPYG